MTIKRKEVIFNGKQENDLKSLYKFIFDFSGNFISIFGFLIYLEIIELGFCKLNYDLRKYSAYDYLILFFQLGIFFCEETRIL